MIHLLTMLASAAAITALLICVLHPWLERYALARPNARSSHTKPTPQGGGIAIIAAVSAIIVVCAVMGVAGFREAWVVGLLVAMTALAIAGVVDDIKPLPVLPRLALQLAAASLLVATLPRSGSVLPFLPRLIEDGLIVLALVWFINLTNFMDGIDLMTVVEVVPIAACLAVVGISGIVPEITALLPVVVALLGAMLAFAPFNAHVARLFLGDVGSLPIGALVGWLLLVLAAAGHIVAALILPLYYLADATLTLLRRWMNGENVSQAHRSHFYQRAVQGRLSVPQVTRDVLLLNGFLAVLAVMALRSSSTLHQFGYLLAAVAVTLIVLARFEYAGRDQGNKLQA